jgi:hypothetical protein
LDHTPTGERGFRLALRSAEQTLRLIGRRNGHHDDHRCPHILRQAGIETEVMRRHGVTLCHDHRPLNHVLEFANVAWPLVREQRGDRGLIEPHRSCDVVMTLEHRSCERDDIAGSLPQRLKLQREDIQAVVQVFAKTARLHIRQQITVSRGQQTKPRLHRSRRAERRELTLLQHSQQLGLHAERQFAHLIQKQRAAIGLLEEPFEPLGGSGESPFLVPEQQVLDHRLRQAGAVKSNKVFAFAERPIMDVPSQHFLASAGGAADEHGDLGTRNTPRKRQQLRHERIAEHHLRRRARPHGNGHRGKIFGENRGHRGTG